jgi:hypothetical protein
MLGSATTTIVMSTIIMNVPRHTASSVQFLCGVRVGVFMPSTYHNIL